MNVKTNAGKTFFKLLQKHFPPIHPMYTIFNKNKITISYSCSPNTGSIISLHNKHILNSNNTEYGCNCNTTSKTDEHKYYYGISDTPFKERYENHKTYFRYRSDLTASYLSKYYWKLVDKGAAPTINFSIAKLVKGNTVINNCNLCLSEKTFIIRSLDDVNILNKRSEFTSKCRHINKRLLNRVKDDSNDCL